jgi:hypothetical protein
MQEKKCVRCGISKSLDEYHKDSERKDGKKIYCKPCAAEKQKEFKYGTERKPNKAVAERIVKEHKQGSKKCSICKKEKKYEKYTRNAASKDRYAARCKDCDAKAHIKKKTEINYAAFYYPVALD